MIPGTCPKVNSMDPCHAVRDCRNTGSQDTATRIQVYAAKYRGNNENGLPKFLSVKIEFNTGQGLNSQVRRQNCVKQDLPLLNY
jgi:hypothetical protein